jgi:hypothetical protein
MAYSNMLFSLQNRTDQISLTDTNCLRRLILYLEITMPIISPRRISLRMAVGSMVTLLLITLGVILTLYSFENQKKSTLQKMSRIFTQTALITDEKLASMLIPVRTFVEITSQLPNLSRDNITQYQEYLPYMAQILTKGQSVSSVYVGYNDGSFYMLSYIQDDAKALANTNAPQGTVFYLKEISQIKDRKQIEETFLDGNIRQIKKIHKNKSTFDPRQRPWYQGALASETTYTTDPYLFHTSRDIGYTISKKLTDQSGVVGVDISIQKLISVLEKQKHTPSTQLLLFHADGRILLSSEPDILLSRYIKSRQTNDLNLSLHNLQSPVMKEMYTTFKQSHQKKTPSP